jgi:hypothetical protein
MLTLDSSNAPCLTHNCVVVHVNLAIVTLLAQKICSVLRTRLIYACYGCSPRMQVSCLITVCSVCSDSLLTSWFCEEQHMGALVSCQHLHWSFNVVLVTYDAHVCNQEGETAFVRTTLINRTLCTHA